MRPSVLAATALLFLAVRAIAQEPMASPQPLASPELHSDAGGGFHNHGHAVNHDWYQRLNQPGTTYSCCNGDEKTGDCRPTRAFLGDDGFWHAQVDGRWVTVPHRAVLEQLAPDGNSHICASKGGYIFCFIGGSPKS